MHRLVAAAALFAAMAPATPPLTTIQDVLYKADGTRFNGQLTISWDSFEATDKSNITTQSLTVKVVNGNLRVQLVPNLAASVYYTVVYNSDGRVQFSETWSVAASSSTLRVRDVRVASSTSSSSSGTIAADTAVTESAVTGLVADLASRPVKGTGYITNRTAYVNAEGALDSVLGSASDCVKVDGTSGPCSVDLTFVDNEIPTGTIDGSNTAFTLTYAPSPTASLAVYRNGVLLKLGQDYTLASNVITFVSAMTPLAGDTLLASYRLSQNISTVQPYPLAQAVCSGIGASTASTTAATLGICTIPASLLAKGDRVEILLDFEHSGTSSGFHVDAVWGSTTIASADGTSGDLRLALRADAALWASGTQVSWQRWGNSLAFGAGMGTATDTYTNGITLTFTGRVSSTNDSVALKQFSVIRLP